MPESTGSRSSRRPRSNRRPAGSTAAPPRRMRSRSPAASTRNTAIDTPESRFTKLDATTRRRYRPDDRIVRRRTDSGIPHRRHPNAQWRHDAAEQPVPGGRQRRQRQFSKDRAALLHRQLERFRRESLRFRIAFAHGSRYRLRSQGRRIHRRYRRHPGGDRRRCREGGRTGRARRRRLVLRQTLCRDQHPAEKQHRTAHRRRRDPLAVAGRARLQV